MTPLRLKGLKGSYQGLQINFFPAVQLHCQDFFFVKQFKCAYWGINKMLWFKQ